MIDQVIWARAIVPFLVYDWSYILIQVSQVSPTRPERAKALKLQAIYKASAPSVRAATMCLGLQPVLKPLAKLEILIFFSLFLLCSQK